jgi:hypothetical protein
VVFGADRIPIAYAHNIHPDLADVQEARRRAVANAKLFAAAPDMYEALEAWQEYHRYTTAPIKGTYSVAHEAELAKTAIRLAKAAMRKAVEG